MTPLQLGYAKYFNTKYIRVGPLFQGRFKARMVDSEEYLLHLSAYIHRNPKISHLLTYPYSSYHEYCHPTSKNISKPDDILQFFSKSRAKNSYESFVEQFQPNYEILAPLLPQDD